MTGEIPADFSAIINEFNNKPGAAFNAEVARQISQRWEFGANLSYSKLKGETQHPVFTAVGNHASMNNLRDEPVVYFNDQSALYLLSRYYFPARNPSGKESAATPFVNAGIGYVTHKAALKYKNDPSGEIIFGKSVDGYRESFVSNAIYVVGAGVRFPRASGIGYSFAFNTKFVGYDFLDVVHNYNSDGSRKKVLGIYSELTVGISWQTGHSSLTPVKRKSKKAGNSYLPWYRRK